MKKSVKGVNVVYTKILIDSETHYIRKNGKTYCGIEIPKGVSGRNTIEIITCNRCVNIYINKGII